MNFPDLHRHLGGATHPRILWGYIEKHGRETDVACRLRERFGGYDGFAREFSRPFADLADYLTVHHLVESLQAEDVPYFATRAVRGAAVFESIDYLEIRFNPYKRTPSGLPQLERIKLLPEITAQVIRAGRATGFPINTAYILCMDRGFPLLLNRAIMYLAHRMPEVVGVDLAGPYQDGGMTWEEWARLFAEAKSVGLKTTAHMAESDPDDVHPELFPHLDRIGHGIQIALNHPHHLPELAERRICLEVCPTTYLRTNTLQDLSELAPVFARCEDAGVPVSIATDNPALHGDSGRIVGQYEVLVRADVIHFNDILRYTQTGYEHAFGDVRGKGN
ncbi:MAG: adenosine deaminase [Akkermansiaceae bacterium]|nr:adenosine deaminase [Armatimonadota bacterium]